LAQVTLGGFNSSQAYCCRLQGNFFGPLEFKENCLYLVHSHCQDKFELAAALICSLQAEINVSGRRQKDAEH